MGCFRHTDSRCGSALTGDQAVVKISTRVRANSSEAGVGLGALSAPSSPDYVPIPTCPGRSSARRTRAAITDSSSSGRLVMTSS